METKLSLTTNSAHMCPGSFQKEVKFRLNFQDWINGEKGMGKQHRKKNQHVQRLID